MRNEKFTPISAKFHLIRVVKDRLIDLVTGNDKLLHSKKCILNRIKIQNNRIGDNI